jgi:hypothetical protein
MEQPNESAPGHERPPRGAHAHPDPPAEDAPNESGPGHNPDPDSLAERPGDAGGDSGKEDVESEQSFPASDPPSNY